MANQQRDGAKESFWRDALRRLSASGLSVRAFCRRERLAESAFYAWRRTIGERDAAGKPAFVPVAVAVAATEAKGDDAGFVVALPGGCSLRLSGPRGAKRLRS